MPLHRLPMPKAALSQVLTETQQFAKSLGVRGGNVSSCLLDMPVVAIQRRLGVLTLVVTWRSFCVGEKACDLSQD